MFIYKYVAIFPDWKQTRLFDTRVVYNSDCFTLLNQKILAYKFLTNSVSLALIFHSLTFYVCLLLFDTTLPKVTASSDNS